MRTDCIQKLLFGNHCLQMRFEGPNKGKDMIQICVQYISELVHISVNSEQGCEDTILSAILYFDTLKHCYNKRCHASYEHTL